MPDFPRIVVFKSTAPASCEPLPAGGIVQQPHDCGGQSGCIGRQRDIDSIPGAKSFRGQGCCNDAASRSPRFDNLETSSAARPQRSHDDGGLGNFGPRIFDGSGDLDAGFFRLAPDGKRWRV